MPNCRQIVDFLCKYALAQDKLQALRNELAAHPLFNPTLLFQHLIADADRLESAHLKSLFKKLRIPLKDDFQRSVQKLGLAKCDLKSFKQFLNIKEGVHEMTTAVDREVGQLFAKIVLQQLQFQKQVQSLKQDIGNQSINLTEYNLCNLLEQNGGHYSLQTKQLARQYIQDQAKRGKLFGCLGLPQGKQNSQLTCQLFKTMLESQSLVSYGRRKQQERKLGLNTLWSLLGCEHQSAERPGIGQIFKDPFLKVLIPKTIESISSKKELAQKFKHYFVEGGEQAQSEQDLQVVARCLCLFGMDIKKCRQMRQRLGTNSQSVFAKLSRDGVMSFTTLAEFAQLNNFFPDEQWLVGLLQKFDKEEKGYVLRQDFSNYFS